MKIHPKQAADIIDQKIELDITLIPLKMAIRDHGRERTASLVRAGWIDVEFIPGSAPSLWVRSDQVNDALAVPIDA